MLTFSVRLNHHVSCTGLHTTQQSLLTKICVTTSTKLCIHNTAGILNIVFYQTST